MNLDANGIKIGFPPLAGITKSLNFSEFGKSRVFFLWSVGSQDQWIAHKPKTEPATASTSGACFFTAAIASSPRRETNGDMALAMEAAMEGA